VEVIARRHQAPEDVVVPWGAPRRHVGGTGSGAHAAILPAGAHLATPVIMRIPEGVRDAVERIFPGAKILRAQPLAADAGADAEGATVKAAGYGKPVRLRVEDGDGAQHELVWHTALADMFGHDRRADRADGMLLAYDTYDKIPRHVRALDVGAVARHGGLIPLTDAGEFYILTSWAPGRPYADDLRRIAADGVTTPLDVARCDALASYLAELHAHRLDRPMRYRRSVRDLVGHGEGAFGMIDSFPADVPAAPAERLRRLEHALVDWRWRLRDRAHRLARIHGDFHPFNVIFDAGTDFALVDASRGCAGDPADDVTAMAINYVFFAVDQGAPPRSAPDRPRAWAALRPLWRAFLAHAVERDGELLDVFAPYFAWRTLVVTNPRFYPDLSAASRDRLLALAERALAATRFDPAWAEDVFP
jgi:aminoglycoside phosphotransferase (APT) family kinase protein